MLNEDSIKITGVLINILPHSCQVSKAECINIYIKLLLLDLFHRKFYQSRSSTETRNGTEIWERNSKYSC